MLYYARCQVDYDDPCKMMQAKLSTMPIYTKPRTLRHKNQHAQVHANVRRLSSYLTTNFNSNLNTNTACLHLCLFFTSIVGYDITNFYWSHKEQTTIWCIQMYLVVSTQRPITISDQLPAACLPSKSLIS